MGGKSFRSETMTDKKTQGNITDAIKALQQGARVFVRRYGDLGEVTLDVGILKWAQGKGDFRVTVWDIRDDDFRIEWPEPRKPKRGEIWGLISETLVVAVDRDAIVVQWANGCLDLVTPNYFSSLSLHYIRDSTPDEMAQFDGGK